MKRTTFKIDQSGQSLPLALVACMALTLVAVHLFNVGRLTLERARTRMRTDATAMSVAVDYSRCLNILATTEKALPFAWITDAALVVATGGEHLANVVTGKSAAGTVAKFQGIGLLGGPWLVEASALNLGRENGLLVVPLWNQEGQGDLLNPRSLMPDLNVYPRDPLVDFEKDFEESQAGKSAKGHAGRPKYSYQKRRTGRRIKASEPEVEKILIKGKKKTRVAYRMKGSKKFVAHRPQKMPIDIPMDLVDGGEHSIALFALRLEREGKDSQGLLKQMPRFTAISKVKISGGDMDVFSFSSSEWGPYFVPFDEEPEMKKVLPIIPASGMAWLDQITEKVNQVTEAASSLQVLH